MIRIVPLRAGDDALLRFVVGRLSPESRYRRFQTAAPLPAEDVLQRLARPDGWHHIALVAVAGPPDTPVAVAQVIRTAAFDVGEVAIAVADAHQRRGVGSTLLDALIVASLAAGIRAVVAETSPENRGAVRLLARATHAPTVTTSGASTVVRALL